MADWTPADHFVPADHCEACASLELRGPAPAWDVHGWAWEIAEGNATSAQVSREVGLTREAVRQALRTHGLHGAVAAGKEAVARRREEEREQRLRDRADEASPNTWSVPRYTEDDVIAAIREVYGRTGPSRWGGFSLEQYRQNRTPDQPSPSTIVCPGNPTWREWAERAGVPPNPPSRRHYPSVSDEAIVAHVARYAAELRAAEGRYASVSAAGYAKWATTDGQAPSLATVSKRMGWAAAKSAAFDLLYG